MNIINVSEALGHRRSMTSPRQSYSSFRMSKHWLIASKPCVWMTSTRCLLRQVLLRLIEDWVCFVSRTPLYFVFGSYPWVAEESIVSPFSRAWEAGIVTLIHHLWHRHHMSTAILCLYFIRHLLLQPDLLMRDVIVALLSLVLDIFFTVLDWHLSITFHRLSAAGFVVVFLLDLDLWGWTISVLIGWRVLPVEVFQNALEALVVLWRKQFLEFCRRRLKVLYTFWLRRCLFLHRLGWDELAGRRCVIILDLLNWVANVVLGDLLDNPRAKIVVIDMSIILLAPWLPKVLNMLVDLHLLSHYVLDVDLVWVVVIFDQSVLDGLSEAFGINGHIALLLIQWI